MLLVAEVDAGRQLTTRPLTAGAGEGRGTHQSERVYCRNSPRLQESKVARAVCAESAEV